MADTASTYTDRNGTIHTNIIAESDKGTPFRRLSYLMTKWDMSKIKISKPRFYLSDKDQKIYCAILRSGEGMKILNDLKNKKTNFIVNSYIEAELKDNIGKDAGKNGALKLKTFLKSVMASPLIGKNNIKLETLSLTKREIWEEFKKNGLTNEEIIQPNKLLTIKD